MPPHAIALDEQRFDQISIAQNEYAERIHQKFHLTDQARYHRYMDTLSRWRIVGLQRIASIQEQGQPLLSSHLFPLPD